MLRITRVGSSPGTLGPSVPLYDIHDGASFVGQAVPQRWPGDGRIVVTLAMSDHRIGQRVITTQRTGMSASTKRRAIADALAIVAKAKQGEA